MDKLQMFQCPICTPLWLHRTTIQSIPRRRPNQDKMTNQEPDVIIVDDSIFYEIEEMIDKKIKELEEKKKLED